MLINLGKTAEISIGDDTTQDSWQFLDHYLPTNFRGGHAVPYKGGILTCGGLFPSFGTKQCYLHRLGNSTTPPLTNRWTDSNYGRAFGAMAWAGGKVLYTAGLEGGCE